MYKFERIYCQPLSDNSNEEVFAIRRKTIQRKPRELDGFARNLKSREEKNAIYERHSVFHNWKVVMIDSNF